MEEEETLSLYGMLSITCRKAGHVVEQQGNTQSMQEGLSSASGHQKNVECGIGNEEWKMEQKVTS